MNQWISQQINLSIYLSMNEWMNKSVNESINESMNQSVQFLEWSKCLITSGSTISEECRERREKTSQFSASDRRCVKTVLRSHSPTDCSKFLGPWLQPNIRIINNNAVGVTVIIRWFLFIQTVVKVNESPFDSILSQQHLRQKLPK